MKTFLRHLEIVLKMAFPAAVAGLAVVLVGILHKDITTLQAAIEGHSFQAATVQEDRDRQLKEMKMLLEAHQRRLDSQSDRLDIHAKGLVDLDERMHARDGGARP
jgi:hypothetical protein